MTKRQSVLSIHKSSSAEMKVTYPKRGQLIGAIDSTFIFGWVKHPEESILEINGSVVPVHKDGGWLAYLPIEPGEFEFNLRLLNTESHSLIDSLILTVNVPEPKQSLPDDSLLIAGEYRQPSWDMSLTAGETLELSIQGTPGSKAWASIDGLADSIPMTETPPRTQPFWGENVFGQGSIPDSLKITGIYTGQITIPSGIRLNAQPIQYHLLAPDIGQFATVALKQPNLANHVKLARMMEMPDEVTFTSERLLTVNSDRFPRVVLFTDSVQIIRHQPGRGYFSIFQPAGVKCLAVGQMGDWYRIQLSPTQFAYCEAAKVDTLPIGSLPPSSLVRSVRTNSFDDSVVVEIPLSDQHAYQVVETDRETVVLNLFGVTTDTDWIRYDANDSLIDYILWSQPEPEKYQLTIRLTDPIWGYDGHYEGNNFRLTFFRQPSETSRLRGKRVVIDPGHSSDAGSVGPTGMTEAEANLGIALVLAHMLRRADAEVIMTRDDMSHVALYDRPSIAKSADADLFISIHNNALPDGVNPFVNNGVSTYYYHLHSLDLARAIQSRMVEETGANSHGLYHGNLAVNRPTQYPAVLVECAFMMIPEQEAALKTDRYRHKVAKAIMNGIEDFLNSREKEGNND